ncbi:acyltransferase [Pseudothauera rhizosphaerae]|uniref:Acyltransferase n=1 Tax=Pseudothauera rhizosphaerae TaxID=2565932 RepID=A0A4S4AFV5_9RHOO|nr:acyltransferase [Pseudothauera rhizosphaerae]THF57627.1 acyltransferase [Pseudothauera rhizosphaerae]
MSRPSPFQPIPRPLIFVRALVRTARLARLRLKLGDKLKHGENFHFGRNCTFLPPEYIRFGTDISIGANFHLETNLEIGDGVLISSSVSIIGNDHKFDGISENVYWGGRLPPSTVIIEGDNLIGFGSIIIGNVRIGHGCIVGAGSIVTRDLPAGWVCHGSPAIPVRKRSLGKL